MFNTRPTIVVAALAAASSSFAVNLGSVTAFYTGAFGIQNVKYSHSYGSGGTRTDPTVQFRGDRSDLPAGPGVSNVVPDRFIAYCVEVGEFIHLNATSTHVESFVLQGSTTHVGGFTGARTFSATRTRHLQRLWGNFLGSVNSNATSAAFQLAQWEITFDDDMTLVNQSGAKMWVNPGDATAISALAETWLTQIRTNQVTAETPLLLLRRPGLQDMVTPVPEPATLAALGLGAAFLMRRRRKA